MPQPCRPRRSRRFDLIAFDWDGTLYDSTAIIVRSIQEAVRDVGGTVPSDKEAAYVIGMALIPGAGACRARCAARKVPGAGQPLPLSLPAAPERPEPVCRVLPMLNDLRERGHLLAIATGKNRRGLDEVLHSVDLRGVFDGSRTADQTAGKPHPLMLQELMAEFDVPPERLLMIGDTTHDLQMALNAGCASVGSATAPTSRMPSMSSSHCLFAAHSVAQLHGWLLIGLSDVAAQYFLNARRHVRAVRSVRQRRSAGRRLWPCPSMCNTAGRLAGLLPFATRALPMRT